jgi:hypothetical protein
MDRRPFLAEVHRLRRVMKTHPHILSRLLPAASLLLLAGSVWGSETTITGPVSISQPGTYVLAADLEVSGTAITIHSEGVVIDGRGFRLSGDEATGKGIHLAAARAEATVRDVIIEDFAYGIEGMGQIEIANVTLRRNTVGLAILGILFMEDSVIEESGLLGARLDGPAVLRRTSFLRNNRSFWFSPDPHSLRNLDIDLTNEIDDRPMLFLSDAAGVTIGPEEDFGIVVIYDSSNIEIAGARSERNVYGIVLSNCTNVKITDSTVSRNEWGLLVANTSPLVVTDSIFAFNSQAGAQIDGSSGRFSNNYFLNEQTSLRIQNSTLDLSEPPRTGPNIVGGPMIGGNYWGHPDGTGFSQTCEASVNGFCQQPYLLPEGSGSIDPLPLTMNFELWRMMAFSPAELSDPSVSGPAVDPGGYGVVNLLRYALGLHPRAPDRRQLPHEIKNAEASGSPKIAYLFTRGLGVWDVEFTVETSADLGGWHPLDPDLLQQESLLEEPRRIAVSVPLPVAPDTGREFARLRVSQE